jgi:hypothetical protein
MSALTTPNTFTTTSLGKLGALLTRDDRYDDDIDDDDLEADIARLIAIHRARQRGWT